MMGRENPLSPCAACKFLRRRCLKEECVFAPHFPADQPHKFASVHRVFGASNITKFLQELPEQRRGDAVSSMAYEADARMRDPVYGCTGAIAALQHKVEQLEAQLAMAQAQVVCMQLMMQNQRQSGGGITSSSPTEHPSSSLDSTSSLTFIDPLDTSFTYASLWT